MVFLGAKNFGYIIPWHVDTSTLLEHRLHRPKHASECSTSQAGANAAVSQAIAGAGGGTHTTHAVGTGRHFLIEVSGT